MDRFQRRSFNRGTDQVILLDVLTFAAERNNICILMDVEVFKAAKINLLTLITLICLGLLQAPTNFAHAYNCSRLFKPLDDKSVLENAYNIFLAGNKFKSPNIQQIEFRGKIFEVQDFLGSGAEGYVFRVRDSLTRKTSIIKVYKPEIKSIKRVSLEYFLMRFASIHPYKIKAVDFKNKSILFEDMRGIPLHMVYKSLKEANASTELTELVRQILIKGQSEYNTRQNQVLDIDRMEIVTIDLG